MKTLTDNLQTFLSRAILGVLFAALIFAALPANAAATAAARASLVRGDVTVTTEAGEARPLRRGDQLMSGDTVITDSKAIAQLVFMDRSVLYIKSGSSVKLENFHFAGTSSGNEEDKSVTDLLKGGMRSVTGLVGKSDPEKVIYRAQDITIGIRGTALEINTTDNSTEVTFDFGYGYVETTRAGICERTELGQGDAWILSASTTKQRIVARGKGDPAYVAQYLATAKPEEARSLSASVSEDMTLQDLMLTVAMMREVRQFDGALLEATVAGMSGSLPATDVPTLLTGVTMAYPDGAADILSAAVSVNTDITTATASVMCGLADQPDTTVQPLVDRAVDLGLTAPQAQQVLNQVQSGGCWSS
jgi:hypothetical protein